MKLPESYQDLGVEYQNICQNKYRYTCLQNNFIHQQTFTANDNAQDTNQNLVHDT
jgi:hypothetical protein